MPTLNIKDPEVYRLAQELAIQRGTTMTGAVRLALTDALARGHTVPVDREGIAERIMEIARRARETHGTDDFLTDDDIYDENGVPK